MYNILFLDFDGVLNSVEGNRFKEHFDNNQHYENLLKSSPYDVSLDDLVDFSPILCSNLAKILRDVPDIRIVLSTSWRKLNTIQYFNELFFTLGISKIPPCVYCGGKGFQFYSRNKNGEMIQGKECSYCKGSKKGKEIPFEIIIDKTPDLNIDRHIEIKKWLEANPDKVKKFAIVDDENVCSEDYFIRTDKNTGLEYYSTKKIIDYFGKS